MPKLLPAIFLMCLMSATGAVAQSPQTYIYTQGATKNGSLPLALDFYAAENACQSPRATVILTHGGGFRAGSRKSGSLIRFAQMLNSAGLNAALIDYRKVRDNPTPEISVAKDIPNRGDQTVAASAAIEDLAAAMNWLAQREDALCVDPKRIGLLGSSAGSIASMFVAHQSDELSLRRPDPFITVSLWGGYLPPEAIDKGEAPLLMLHGSDDAVIPVAHANRIYAQARRVGAASWLHVVEGGGHGFKELGIFDKNVFGAPLAEHIVRIIIETSQGEPFTTRLTRSKM